jgi:NADH:ubiquinone oxidoreductase subunit 2 (subunit N)
LWTDSTAIIYLVGFKGARAKTNPILAITLSITMFSYAGTPPSPDFVATFICSIYLNHNTGFSFRNGSWYQR